MRAIGSRYEEKVKMADGRGENVRREGRERRAGCVQMSESGARPTRIAPPKHVPSTGDVECGPGGAHEAW